MKTKAIFWFTNDLRLEDNLALIQSVNTAELALVYIIDPSWFELNSYQSRAMGKQRLSFLKQSLTDLDSQLANYNQSLQIFYGKPDDILSSLIEDYAICQLYRSELADYNLNCIWQSLKNNHPGVDFIQHATHTLFESAQLPFAVKHLPPTFTQFRKAVESLHIAPPLDKPVDFTKKLDIFPDQGSSLYKLDCAEISRFRGGSTHALAHLNEYFKDARPHCYFEVRNSLDGWQNSTKFSPWLANGCLSARQVMASLSDYESSVIRNKSTYWIYFELLWREYFQWYAHKYGSRLFRFSGIKKTPPLTSFYPERFKKWCNGTTPYPLVNACMNELNSTGYVSNRGRQIVASCFINELGLDWRFGAAYFEQQLIDYDVASNWGNWQYLAGVGADPRGKRHFNLDKQSNQFDPSGEYTLSWTKDQFLAPLDSVDAADWPLS